jgi:hypothetical protein
MTDTNNKRTTSSNNNNKQAPPALSGSTSSTSTATPEILAALWQQMRSIPSRHGTGSERGITYKALSKVNWEGNYLPFPNITVVCPLPNRGDAFTSLPAALQQVAGDYMTPLPASSYHATLICGPIGATMPQIWGDVLYDDSSCWRDMVTYLDSVPYAPKDMAIRRIVCKSKGGVTVYIGPTFTVASSLKKNKKSEAYYSGDSATHIVRKKLREISPYMEERDRPWHVTLAYPRAAGGLMPEPIRQQVVEIVANHFAAATRTNEGGILDFEPATMCLSPDMTRFVPWNGEPLAPREDIDSQGS